MKAIFFLKRNIKLWKSQDKGKKIDEEDISFLENEPLAQEEKKEKNIVMPWSPDLWSCDLVCDLIYDPLTSSS